MTVREWGLRAADDADVGRTPRRASRSGPPTLAAMATSSPAGDDVAIGDSAAGTYDVAEARLKPTTSGAWRIGGANPVPVPRGYESTRRRSLVARGGFVVRTAAPSARLTRAIVVSLFLVLVAASRASAAAVRVVGCRTSYGVTQHSESLPGVIGTNLSAKQARGLAFYGNNDVLVLAPAGWGCSGEVGADGSTSMGITHGHESVTESAIVSGGYAGSFEACSLFRDARPPVRCAEHPPLAETDVRLSRTAIAFHDPPGVHGTGVRSGGALPAYGVMLYDPSVSTGFYFEETCVLPASEHRLCTVLLDDALRRAPS
jgi:hypothetical protein